MKVKSSEMLELCLQQINAGKYDYVCSALTGCEYDLRVKHKENIAHKADKLWLQFKPSNIIDGMKMTQPWWVKGDSARIDSLCAAIVLAKSKGD